MLFAIADPSTNSGVQHLTDVAVKLLVIGILIGAIVLMVNKGRGKKLIEHGLFGLVIVVAVTASFWLLMSVIGAAVIAFGAVLAAGLPEPRRR